jgi:hypothetical protein
MEGWLIPSAILDETAKKKIICFYQEYTKIRKNKQLGTILV